MKAQILLLTYLFSSFISLGQNSLVLKMKIAALQGQHATLWSFYGEEERFVDSIRFGENGLAIYRTQKELPKGLYKIELPNTNTFELIIAEPKISLTTDVVTTEKSMVIKKSSENQHYYAIKHFIAHQRALFYKYDNLYSKGGIDAKTYETIKQDINEAIRQKKEELVKNYPNLVVSTFIKAEMNPIIDTTLKQPYVQYIEDYLGNIDFDNLALLHSPILNTRIDNYVSDVVAPFPTEKIAAIDRVLAKCKKKEMRQFIISMFLKKYRGINQIGDDEIFTHIVNSYLNELNLSETEKKRYETSAEKLGQYVRGKDFPTKTIINPNLLDSIDAKYTVAILWNKKAPRKELELLYDFSQSYKRYGLKVFAIGIDTDLNTLNVGQKNNWVNTTGQKELADNIMMEGSIMLVLLDKNKKILARDISLDFLIDTINAWEK